MRDFAGQARRIRPILVRVFGAAEAGRIEAEAHRRFAKFLPLMPDIGRRWQNCFEIELVLSTIALAYYRAYLAHGLDARQAAAVHYLAAQQFYGSLAWPLRWAFGRLMFLRPVHCALRRYAARSHRRRHADDFVFDVVPGDGSSFDFGLDFRECAIAKFFHRIGAEDFHPLLCTVDYPMSQAANVGFVRARCLSTGDDRCTFRYTRGGPVIFDATALRCVVDANDLLQRGLNRETGARAGAK